MRKQIFREMVLEIGVDELLHYCRCREMIRCEESGGVACPHGLFSGQDVTYCDQATLGRITKSVFLLTSPKRFLATPSFLALGMLSSRVVEG